MRLHYNDGVMLSRWIAVDLDKLREKQEKNREQRLQFVKRWAEYVRDHDDEEWSRQANKVVDGQRR
jgi:hypothetical protein